MSDWPSHNAGRAGPLDEIDLAHLWYELDLDHAQLPPIAPQPTPALKRRGADTTAKSGRTRASLRSHALHRLYRLLVARRTAEGKSKRDIIRCLKRYVIRELYHLVKVNPRTGEIVS